MSNALGLSDEESPAVLSAFMGFIGWASQYGHELRQCAPDLVALGVAGEHPVTLELSAVLSASFNFGYDPQDQAVFMAIDKEEFEWLPDLPIAEVVIGISEVYVLIRSVSLGGEVFEAMAITVRTGQPKLWRAFPDAGTVGFMCVRHAEQGYEVTELSGKRFPLRYLND